jgi:hypothetical protein
MCKSFGLAIASILVAQAAMAATVSVSIVSPRGDAGVSIGRAPSASAIAAGAPADARIHEFTVTTDADILQVDQVVITLGAGVSLYNVANPSGGSNAEPPTALFETLVPSLSADTWISTPGATSIAGNDQDPFGSTNNSWFDTTADGAVSNFMFARLTATASYFSSSFSGRVQVVGANGPENFPFTVAFIGPEIVPEPASIGMMAAAMMGLAVFRRRLVPSACFPEVHFDCPAADIRSGARPQ